MAVRYARRHPETGEKPRFSGPGQGSQTLYGGARLLVHRYLHSWIVRPMSLDLERAPGLTARMENTRTDPQTTPAAPATTPTAPVSGAAAPLDPVVAAAHAITALQSVVARNIDPRDMGVVTVGAIHGGAASNVIPDTVEFSLTLRSYRDEVRTQLKERVAALIRSTAEGFGATAEVGVHHGFPSVVNHIAETRLIRDIAAQTFGDSHIDAGFAPRTASEDFAYYLHHRPGSFVFVGNGDSAPLHSPEYRFNDDIIAPAATLWVALARRFLNGVSR